MTKTSAQAFRSAGPFGDVTLTPWPWPDETGGRALAIATNALAVLAGLPGADRLGDYQKDPRLMARAEAASAVIEDYAPGAPDGVRNEAMARFVGYLWNSESTGFGVRKSSSAGPLNVRYETDHSKAFRQSGAMALLARWRVRRAGVI